MADYRLAAPAEAQIHEILSWSHQNFGRRASERYAALLVAAMADIADDPTRPTIIWHRLRRNRV
ncbi:MAG: type II toxin-antitoxin system RelE/ParE family toxin, partial [Proteobacteria bacterium]|nr:type II toxin-antitoxin system RelE/ParE family toxin [Pseudomonadota bacterium]